MRFGSEDRAPSAVFWLWIGFWLRSIAFNHLWCRHFRRGPAEALMRSLTT